jgi:hypothetical protein
MDTISVFKSFPADIRRLVFVNLENNIDIPESSANNSTRFVSLIDKYYAPDDYIWNMIFEKAFGEPNPIQNNSRDEYLKVKKMDIEERQKYAEMFNMEKFKRRIFFSGKLESLIGYIEQQKTFLKLGADIHMKNKSRTKWINTSAGESKFVSIPGESYYEILQNYINQPHKHDGDRQEHDYKAIVTNAKIMMDYLKENDYLPPS